MLRRTFVLGVTLTLAFAPAAAPQTQPPEVPYVPTHENIVARMLAIADVKKTDVLYDLGSGDGRIPITAAKRFGTRGVGVDIDPVRVKEANENARAAGVTPLVKFLEQDLFKTDIREATVVTLYLLPEVNLRLRPTLLNELAPGTRVVSHNYDMGDWKPLAVETITIGGDDHYIYYWVVPPRSGESR